MLTLRPYLKELMKKGHYAPTLCSRPQTLCLSIFENGTPVASQHNFSFDRVLTEW